MPKQPKCSQVEKGQEKPATCWPEGTLRLQGSFQEQLLLTSKLLHHLICMLNRPFFLRVGPNTHSPRDLPVFLSRLTHHAVPVVSPVPVEVGQVTVLVPPGAAVGQSAVTQGNVIIQVNSGPGTALVIRHSIACRTRTNTCVCVCGLLHVCLSWNKLF